MSMMSSRTVHHHARPGPAAGQSSPPEAPRSNPGPSAKPAFVVFAAALAICLGGALALALTSAAPRNATPRTLVTASHDPVPAVPAAPSIAAMVAGGQPPSDVVAALAFPRGTQPVAGSIDDQTVGSYDRSMLFTVALPEAQVIAFFHYQLRAQGWTSFSQGKPAAATRAPAGSIEVLARRPASDGNFWQVGLVVEPTTFSSSSTVDTTAFQLHLFVVPDPL